MPTTPVPHDYDPGSGCPDAELLASYVDGRASSSERETVEAHLARCEDCSFALAETVRARAEDDAVKKPDWRRWAPMAAAGLAVAATLVVAVMLGRNYQSQPSSTLVVALNELDAASGPYRAFEPRITAIPTHRPLQPAMRTGSPSADAPVTLREAAIKVEQAARTEASETERLRALAAAYLAQGQARQAVGALSPLEDSPSDARVLNDIAAAHLARKAEGDAKLALELLEKAVSLDPNRAEAWFNLGLAAESAQQIPRAREAWTRYLALDSSSEWAAEARRHLKTLKQEQPAPQSRFVQVTPERS